MSRSGTHQRRHDRNASLKKRLRQSSKKRLNAEKRAACIAEKLAASYASMNAEQEEYWGRFDSCKSIIADLVVSMGFEDDTQTSLITELNSRVCDLFYKDFPYNRIHQYKCNDKTKRLGLTTNLCPSCLNESYWQAYQMDYYDIFGFLQFDHLDHQVQAQTAMHKLMSIRYSNYVQICTMLGVGVCNFCV
jgi:hypothetical protein